MPKMTRRAGLACGPGRRVGSLSNSRNGTSPAFCSDSDRSWTQGQKTHENKPTFPGRGDPDRIVVPRIGSPSGAKRTDRRHLLFRPLQLLRGRRRYPEPERIRGRSVQHRFRHHLSAASAARGGSQGVDRGCLRRLPQRTQSRQRMAGEPPRGSLRRHPRRSLAAEHLRRRIELLQSGRRRHLVERHRAPGPRRHLPAGCDVRRGQWFDQPSQRSRHLARHRPGNWQPVLPPRGQ